MTVTRMRAVVLIAAVLTLAACGAGTSTSPDKQLRPTTATRDVGDSIPDPMCRSGFSGPNGRCID